MLREKWSAETARLRDKLKKEDEDIKPQYWLLVSIKDAALNSINIQQSIIREKEQYLDNDKKRRAEIEELLK